MNTDWKQLPDVVMIEVMKYLPDRDRARMALVCQKWNDIFNSACLWRVRHFELGGYKAQAFGLNACNFVDRFGKHLKKMSLSCNYPSFHTCKVFQKSIENMFTTLKESDGQLNEFELCRLDLDRHWRYDTPREKLISVFSKFFKTQKRITNFNMSYAQMPAYGGCRVLDSLGYKAGSTIEDFMIEDFFHARLPVFRMKKFPGMMEKFTALKYVALNYNCLSEDIIELFTKNLNKTLNFLSIKVSQTDPHVHTIPSLAWKQLVRARPRLQIAVWFEGIGLYSEISNVLVKGIPVKDLHLWTGYDDDSDWRLSRSISHIADLYANTIESVSLELDNAQDIVDEEILQLVLKCKRLKELTINAMICIPTVQNICEMQRHKKIALSLFHVTFCGMMGSFEEEFTHFRDHYTDVFRADPGFNFSLYRFDF